MLLQDRKLLPQSDYQVPQWAYQELRILKYFYFSSSAAQSCRSHGAVTVQWAPLSPSPLTGTSSLAKKEPFLILGCRGGNTMRSQLPSLELIILGLPSWKKMRRGIQRLFPSCNLIERGYRMETILTPAFRKHRHKSAHGQLKPARSSVLLPLSVSEGKGHDFLGFTDWVRGSGGKFKTVDAWLLVPYTILKIQDTAVNLNTLLGTPE